MDQPKIDLRPDHWVIVHDILRRHVPDRAVWAFGSRATWTAKESSDLDLAVLGDSPLPLATVAALEEALAESDLPFKVDVVDWNRVSQAFRQVIKAEHTVLQTQHEESSTLNWRESTWGDEITLEYGKALRDYHPSIGQYRVFGSNGPIGWTDKCLSDGPGVILGRKGAYRGVQYSGGPFFVIDTAYYVVPKTELDMRWLYYAITYYKLGEIDDGSPIPSTTRSAVYVRDLMVPPLDDQRAIAHILGTLDDKIDLNRRMNATLEAMARALFKSWFVDFDPVRAKAEGRDTGLPSEIEALFPNHLVESELGEIPTGWVSGTVTDLAEIVGGSTPKTERAEYWDGGIYHWATPKDLSGSNIPVLLETERKITDAGLGQISSGLLPAGTILLSSRAPIGYLAIAEVDVAVNQGFIAIKPTSTGSKHYLLRWAESAHDEIVSHANGSTFLEISKSSFRRIRILVPSEAVLGAFDRLAETLYQRVVDNEQEARTLADQRDLLLPKLISGDFQVSGVD